MSEKVTRWLVTNKDVPFTLRAGAWEVAFSLDGKGCNTIIFSGPDARRLSEEYQAYTKAYLEADALLE
jgi:hypothetical protein